MSIPIYLFDISAYLHRAMHVTYGDKVREIVDTDTAFLRQACAMLSNTVNRLDIKRMVLVRDSSELSLRCDDYPDYKKERKEHPPVLKRQMPAFFERMQDISVAVVERPRYEADDLIATIVTIPRDAEYVIVSSDKDLMAHVGDPPSATGGSAQPMVWFYDPMKDVHVSREEVKKKFGVDPTQLFDYTGLVGDTSDGIPGIRGVGPKTAAKLLKDFDSLDEIYSPERLQALGEVLSKKQLATILEGRDAAFLSRRLAAPMICKQLDAPVDCDAPSASIIRSACN